MVRRCIDCYLVKCRRLSSTFKDCECHLRVNFLNYISEAFDEKLSVQLSPHQIVPESSPFPTHTNDTLANIFSAEQLHRNAHWMGYPVCRQRAVGRARLWWRVLLLSPPNRGCCVSSRREANMHCV